MSEREDGDCFVVAANIVSLFDHPAAKLYAGGSVAAAIEVASALGLSEHDLTLAHGLVTRKADGRVHCHAWVELEGLHLVLEYSNGHTSLLPVTMYYAVGEIIAEEVVKYSCDETRRMMVEHETYGPWAEELQA